MAQLRVSRVLFSSTPGVGHVNSMLPLARAMRDLGADVLWALPQAASVALAQDAFPVRPVGRSSVRSVADIVAADATIRALPPSERPNHVFAKLFGRERTQYALNDLVPLVQDWQPGLIVRDAAEFAAPIAAALAGVPCVTHAFGALLPEGRVARAGVDVAPLWEEHGLTPRPYGGSYDSLYLDIFPPGMQDQERPHIPRTQHLRPAERPEREAESSPRPARPAWAEPGRPLVYATFGTVFNDPDALRQVVAGIAKLDVSVLVTVGAEVDPAVLDPQPRNVFVAGYLPQRLTLPYADLVVSHGGSGTFLAAAAAAIPQLCVPQGADQYLNAEACARSGIGLSLPAPALPDQVREAVARLLGDATFASAAEVIARDIETMPSPTEVARSLLQ